MIEAFELINQVQDRFRGLPEKLHRLFGKSDDWWRSHRYKPRRLSADANGNTSEADSYIQFIEKYEAAQPHAGQYLNELVYQELKLRFDAEAATSQRTAANGMILQCSQAAAAINEREAADASINDLNRWDTELGEAADSIATARSVVRAERIRRKLSVNGGAQKA